MRLICVVVGALALNACTAAPPDTAADVKAVEATRSAFARAYTDEDAAKVATLFTPDGILMEDKGQQIKGRDAIRAHYETLMKDMQTDLELKSEETQVSGDWAFDRGQTWVHIMSKDPKSTLPMIMDQGKYVAVLRKQTDGGWLISHVISNSNIGPPPAPAAQ